MQIQIDSREKARAIKKIIGEFERQNIPHFVSKLYVGDYCNLLNPLVIIDRKQNVAEIAQNATSGHGRFKRELERLRGIGGKMYILIEQDKDGERPLQQLSDIILWKPKYGKILGEQIYKILANWQSKYEIEFIFCSKKDTGKKIIELLKG